MSSDENIKSMLITLINQAAAAGTALSGLVIDVTADRKQDELNKTYDTVLAVFTDLKAERDRWKLKSDEAKTPEQENRIWRNMVAVLCGDGGHYCAEHGPEQTAKYIEGKIFKRSMMNDRLVAMLEEAQITLAAVDAIYPGRFTITSELSALLAEAKKGQ